MTTKKPFKKKTEYFTVNFESKTDYNKVIKHLKLEGLTLDYYLLEFDLEGVLGQSNQCHIVLAFNTSIDYNKSNQTKGVFQNAINSSCFKKELQDS